MSLGRAAPSKDANLVLDESGTFVSPSSFLLRQGPQSEFSMANSQQVFIGFIQCSLISYVETRRLLYEASAQGNW